MLNHKIGLVLLAIALTSCTSDLKPSKWPAVLEVSSKVIAKRAQKRLDQEMAKAKEAGETTKLEILNQVSQLLALYQAWKDGLEPKEVGVEALHQAVELLESL